MLRPRPPWFPPYGLLYDPPKRALIYAFFLTNRRADNLRVLSGIIYVNRNGPCHREASREHGAHKALYKCCKQQGDKGIIVRMMAGLPADHGEDKTVMIDARSLKRHRTAFSRGGGPCAG